MGLGLSNLFELSMSNAKDCQTWLWIYGLIVFQRSWPKIISYLGKLKKSEKELLDLGCTVDMLGRILDRVGQVLPWTVGVCEVRSDYACYISILNEDTVLF